MRRQPNLNPAGVIGQRVVGGGDTVTGSRVHWAGVKTFDPYETPVHLAQCGIAIFA